MLGSNLPHQYVSEQLTGDSIMMGKLKTEIIVNSILDNTTQFITEQKVKKQIWKDLNKISKIYSKSQIERYTRIAECLSPEYLEKERISNRAKFPRIEDNVKKLLHALDIGERSGYAVRYSRYIEVLRQLYEISLMLQAIDEQSEPPSLD